MSRCIYLLFLSKEHFLCLLTGVFSQQFSINCQYLIRCRDRLWSVPWVLARERPLKISCKSFPSPGLTDSYSEVKSHLPDIKLNLYGFHFKQLWNYTACPLIIGGFKVTFFLFNAAVHSDLLVMGGEGAWEAGREKKACLQL